MGLERDRRDLTTTSNAGVIAPEIIEGAEELSSVLEAARMRGATIGFIPTMGALHQGHTSLIGRARAECYHVVVSIFVNPTQFNSQNDFDKYPRDIDFDIETAFEAGADYIFVPSVQEMYPKDSASKVVVPNISSIFEGESRPGHFEGVATIVTKLFSIVGRCKAYFGEKDFQQLQLVRRLVADLHLPIESIACPTVREEDGLALSSRNQRLSLDERYAAGILFHALTQGRILIEQGERSRQVIEAKMQEILSNEPMATLDYASVISADNFLQLDTLAGEVRLLIAANFGDVRLIDNIGVTVPMENQKGQQ